MKRLKKNFCAATFGKIIVFVQQISLVPAYLTFWGPEYYGEWLALTAVPSILATSNLGIGSVAATEIARQLGDGNEDEASSVLFTCAITTIAIFSILIVGLILSCSTLDILSVKRINSPELVVALLLGSNACVMAMQGFDGYWALREKAYIGIWLHGLQPLIVLIASMAVLPLGLEALPLAAVTLLVTLAWSVIYLLAATSILHVRSHLCYRPKLLGLFFGKGIGFQAGALWQVILFQGSILLANGVLGAKSAAVWTTVRILSRAGNQILQLINETVWPELQMRLALKDVESVKSIHANSLVVSSAVSIVFAAFLGVAGPTVYSHWTASTIEVPRSVWVILALGVVLNSVWWTSSLIPRGFNMPWALNLCGIMASVLSLAVMYSLQSFNILGLACGAVFFEAVMSFVVVRISLRLLSESFNSFADRLAKETFNWLGAIRHLIFTPITTR